MAWRNLLALRFKPTADLWAVGVSWILVVAALATATYVITPANGVGYFLAYAVVGAAGFGVLFPTWWTVWRQKRTVADLGVTTRLLWLSIGLQLILSAIQYSQTLANTTLPDPLALLPLVALALSIGLFEAIFWRGWVLLRLEAAFGFFPALLVGSALYALYHVGYGMGWNEIGFLFFIGLLYAAVFRVTKNIFILWPLLQPMGQLTTLINDGLTLPPIAAVGFIEALILMIVVLGVAWRYGATHPRARAGEEDGRADIPTVLSLS